MPHVLERPPLGQIDRRVLAVVEEALLPADVPHRGLGHHHPLQARGRVDARLGDRADAGDSHQVAHRHHPDQLVAVDDRQMPVVVRGQAGPCRIDLLVRAEDIGMGGHPQADLLKVGVATRAAARRRSRSVRIPTALAVP